MNYLKHITAPFKKNGVDVELGQRTLILGDNRTGKSAITNAVEFLLTGKVSQIKGRTTVADVNELYTLGPGEELWAKGVLSNGQEVSLAVKGKKAPPAPFSMALPLRDVKAALAGSVETVRKFFLQMVAAQVSKADVLSRIPAAYQELYTLAVSSTPIATPAVDQLLHALGRAKQRARDLDAEAKAATVVTTEVTSGLTPVSDVALQSARTALAAAREELQKAQARAAAVDRMAKARDELTAAQQRCGEVQMRLGAIQPPAEADRVRENALELVRYAETQRLTTCPCCKTALEGIGPGFWPGRVEAFAAKAESRRQELADYHQLAAQLAEASRAVETAKVRAEGWDEKAPTTAAEYIEAVAVALQTAAAVAQAAEQKVIELERASASWEQARRSRDVAAERQLEAQNWANLADVCKKATGELLDQSTGAFVARVQAHLPDTDTFALVLHEDDREVCRYGYLREGKLDTALSGSEWATLGSALAAAYLESTSSPAKPELDVPYCIIPDDCAWSAASLTDALHAFESSPCQVILATTVPEGFQPPEGWTVIWTSAKPKGGDAHERPEVEVVSRPLPEATGASAAQPTVEAPLNGEPKKRGRKKAEKQPVGPPPGLPPELE